VPGKSIHRYRVLCCSSCLRDWCCSDALSICAGCYAVRHGCVVGAIVILYPSVQGVMLSVMTVFEERLLISGVVLSVVAVLLVL
jgi:hypothetical protein